jgi:hypothetical protein
MFIFVFAGWINKKIKDLVGDDAESAGFAEFIVGEVQGHRSASRIMENVQDVLDEDAVPFVTQLFKVRVATALYCPSKATILTPPPPFPRSW